MIELTLRPGDTLQVCDGVLVVRDIVKEIAAQDGLAATFMAAPDDDVVVGLPPEHLPARAARDHALADHYGEAGLSEVGKAFVAGLLEHAPELCLLYAPNLNSYRRFASRRLHAVDAHLGAREPHLRRPRDRLRHVPAGREPHPGQ